MSDRTRITPDRLAEAVDALDGSPLPPMALFDAVNFHATEATDRLADLWTLRDSLDVERNGQDHATAVRHLAELADLYAGTLDVVRRLADDLGLPLDVDAS